MAANSERNTTQCPPIHLEVAQMPFAERASQETLCLTIDDVKGSYTIPFIQTGPDLRIATRFLDPSVVRKSATLMLGKRVVASKQSRSENMTVAFPRLKPGEYTLRIRGFNKQGKAVSETTWSRVGIGIIVAAIGDSITEGYYGHGFGLDDLRLTADKFPPSAVSKDGRNFPQYAPTTSRHLPSVNCFESWMTRLNDLLSESWQCPVFIANEGWGGITSGGYLHMMQQDANWRKRMHTLAPSVWLLHLGVNDERAKVPSGDFAANMEAIVDLLASEYSAKPECVFLAKPCYDYFEGATEILSAYCKEIDDLVARRGLRHGPDFFDAYSRDKERWYGSDPVHPNVEGMNFMAQLWHQSMLQITPGSSRSPEHGGRRQKP